MRTHEIENWALSIIDRLLLRQPIEDSRVELKSKWPENTKKAARQIAGHANAARGEPILWLIGVDEKAGTIPGIEFTEFSSWYSTVRSAFDELAPEPISLNVPFNGVTIAALYFETDRAPFVVKNQESGPIQREVPWREATGVKSATRSQLLRLLSPLQQLPSLEVIGGALDANPDGEYLRWVVYLALFLTQPSGQQTVIPRHRCNITISILSLTNIGPFQGVRFQASKVDNISATEHVLSVTGPGLFEVKCETSSKLEQGSRDLFTRRARVDLRLQPANTEHTIAISSEMKPTTQPGSPKCRWTTGSYTFYG